MSSIKKQFDETKKEWNEAVDEKKARVKKSISHGISRAKFWGKRFLITVLILGVLSIVGFFLWGNYTYSEGTRAGTLIKISKKGYIFKTYEGQLKLGGIDLKKEDGLSDTWSFSVKKGDLYEKLQSMQGSKVVLYYKEINYAMPWQGDTDYFIVNVSKQEEE